MKKSCLIFFLCILLLGILAGCASDQVNGDNNTTESEPGPGDDASILPVDEKLISALVEYLVNRFTEYDMDPLSFSEKIDKIRDDAPTLFASFKSSSCYYVCGYSNSEHEHESDLHCCVASYTWVKYDHPGQIGEYHNGERCAVAFQIDKASSVKLLSKETEQAPEVEHFQLFVTNFENGINVNEQVAFGESFIYFYENDPGTVYCSTSQNTFFCQSMQCICLEDRYYMPISLYIERYNGERTENDARATLGKYYDTFMDILIFDYYSTTNKQGDTTYFGLIEVETLLEIIDQ